MLGDALQLEQQLVDLERLGQVVVGAFLERGDRVGHLGEGGHQDDLGGRRLLPHPPEQRQPVQLGQADVADHDVEHLRGDLSQTLGAVVGHRHPVPGIAQRIFQRRAQIGLVVDQQDVQHLLRPRHDEAPGVGSLRGGRLGKAERRIDDGQRAIRGRSSSFHAWWPVDIQAMCHDQGILAAWIS